MNKKPSPKGKGGRLGRISLHPLSAEEALREALQVKPPKKETFKKHDKK
jgi:hypothetical protein